MKRANYDFWVGVFMLICIASVFYLAFKVSDYHVGDNTAYYEVYADFDNIGGLKVRAPVKSAGVTVGSVRSIQLDQKSYMARVTVVIAQGFEFPADSTLSILTSGLLGEQYIGIEAGADDTMLQNGDTIMQTQSAIVLEKLIGQFLVNFVTKD